MKKILILILALTPFLLRSQYRQTSANGNKLQSGSPSPLTTYNNHIVADTASKDKLWIWNNGQYDLYDGATGWGLLGNTGTVQATNFIGTTDNIGLSVRTNNNIVGTFTTAGRLGIGTTAPSGNIHVVGTGTHIFERNAADATGSFLILRKSRGTFAAPTATLASDQLGLIRFDGYTGAANILGAIIAATAEEAWTATAAGTKLTFNTVPNTTLSSVERMVINNAGNVGIGITAPTSRLNVKRADWTDVNTLIVETDAAANATMPTDFSKAHIHLGKSEFLLNGQYNINFGYLGASTTNVGAVGIGYKMTNIAAGGLGSLVFGTRNSTTGTVAPTERMRIDENGNTGIATQAPTSKFHVAGSQASSFNLLTAATTLGEHRYVIASGGTTYLVTLPAANTCLGRMYTIKTNGIAKTISTYTTTTGLTSTTLALNSVITLVSDGTSWQQF